MKVIKGGEFLIKQVEKEDVFITEQFSEEQQMMKDAVVEFIDREVWPIKERFEQKDYALTEELMRKAGETRGGILRCFYTRKIRWNWHGLCFNHVGD